MTDQSALDAKYFVDSKVYNCPFCNRRHVSYVVYGRLMFNWSTEKSCEVFTVKCLSCQHVSMHLTYENKLLLKPASNWQINDSLDIDRSIFYSVPTTFFAIDTRVPRVLRELLSEADGCLKMNYLTGASACTRKAIYELLELHQATGAHYDDRITNLRARFPQIESELFEILGHIKDMTSNKVHEQSWPKWDSAHLTLFLETLKSLLYEIYVIPDERTIRSQRIRALIPEVTKKRAKSEPS